MSEYEWNIGPEDERALQKIVTENVNAAIEDFSKGMWCSVSFECQPVSVGMFAWDTHQKDVNLLDAILEAIEANTTPSGEIDADVAQNVDEFCSAITEALGKYRRRVLDVSN